MKYKMSFVRIMISCLLLNACSSSHIDGVSLRREPANDPKGLGFLREKEYAMAKIYKHQKIVNAPPISWLVRKVVGGKVKSFLKELPLKPEVRSRVLAKIDSKAFMNQMVPFLLAMKEIYMAKDDFAKRNFENYIKSIWPKPDALPGLKHSLFTYEKNPKRKIDEKEKSGDKSGVSKKFMGKIVTLIDAILFKEVDFSLWNKPDLSPERIKKINPVVKELMQQVVAEFDIPQDYKEIVDGIINEENRLETLTISIMEVILKTMFENYQIFARKYHREEALKKWMKKELLKKQGSELWSYLRESLDERRYVVHIVVDGLQGQLLESLSSPKSDDPFLSKILVEHLNRSEYKPKNIPYKEPDHQQMDFLSYLIGIRGPYQDKKYLPFFKDLYSKHSNGIAVRGVSTTPTISVRNLPFAMTGAPVDGEGGTLLPNFHYVDRKKDRAYYFFGNDALRFEDLANEKGLKTIFQRMPFLNKMSCNSMYGFGADQIFNPLLNIAAGESSRDFGEILCLAELEKRMKHEKKAISLRKRLLAMEPEIKHWLDMDRFDRDNERENPMQRARVMVKHLAEHENSGLPSYLLFYIPWPDHFAHFKGPFSDEIISPTGELNRLDYWLRRVKEIYSKAGVLDKTLWGMAGDHGLTPVHYLLNPEVVVFDKMKEEGIDLKIKKISSDEGEGPKLNHPLRPNSVKGEDIVIASTAGGNYMIDLFVDQNENWERQPVLEEIEDLTLISGQKVNLITEIAKRLEDTLDYMVVREGHCDATQGDYWLGRMEGDKLVQAWVKRRGERVYYNYSDIDLLNVTKHDYYRKHKNLEVHTSLMNKCLFDAKVDDVETWCFEDEWRLLTSYTVRQDSVNQISHLYDTDLAGTINLFPKFAIGYNSKVPGRHAGEHFHEKDAFVGVWGPMVKAQTRIKSFQNGSVPVVLYEYLSGKKTVKGEDGWGFDSFILDLDIKSK